MWSRIATLLLCSLSTTMASNCYCVISSEHTMCRNDCSRSGNCSVLSGIETLTDSMKAGQLTGMEINEILDTLNGWRNDVADNKKGKFPGPAANMNKLHWSNELADSAQCWANQCRITLDKNRNTLENLFTGQTIAHVTHYNFTAIVANGMMSMFTRLMQMWYDELDNIPDDAYTNETVVRVRSMDPSLAQLIWAKTYEVGCGFAFTDWEDRLVKLIVVCNYWPGGNFDNAPVFEVGTPRSQCKCKEDPLDEHYPSLCTIAKRCRLSGMERLEKVKFKEVPSPWAGNSREEEVKENDHEKIIKVKTIPHLR